MRRRGFLGLLAAIPAALVAPFRRKQEPERDFGPERKALERLLRNEEFDPCKPNWDFPPATVILQQEDFDKSNDQIMREFFEAKLKQLRGE